VLMTFLDRVWSMPVARSFAVCTAQDDNVCYLF
jgi:hypothetical protein